jgi:hypothetical protein
LTAQIGLKESSGDLARSIGKLVAEGAIGDGGARVDGGTGRRGCRPDWNRRYSNSVDSVRSPSETSPVRWVVAHQRTKCRR